MCIYHRELLLESAVLLSSKEHFSIFLLFVWGHCALIKLEQKKGPVKPIGRLLPAYHQTEDRKSDKMVNIE